MNANHHNCSSVGALYIRVSTHEQNELSPDAQKRLGLEFAQNHHILIPDDFIFTESISGRSAEKRPEFQKMIALAKSASHPFDVIIVWKFSRFARNQEESIVYKSMLKKDHVEVISVSEPLIEGPFGNLIERIIEWMDEYYSIRLSGEVKRGMKEKALRHGYQTAPCLGYDAVGKGNPFIINENEFKIVSFIMEQFDLYGYNPSQIARHCNMRSYHTKHGNPFDRRTVLRILENPFYAGTVIWNGISFEGKHETRYTKEQYESRKAKLHTQLCSSNFRSTSPEKHWLSGCLKCSICHANLSYGGSKSCRTFTCWKYAKGIHPTSVSLSSKKAEAAVKEYFNWISTILSISYDYKNSPFLPPASAELSFLQQELHTLALRENRIKEAYQKGIDTLAEYQENKERLLKKRNVLEKKLSTISQNTNDSLLPSFPEKIQHLNVVLNLSCIDNEKKGLFLQTLLDQILFDKKANSLYFDIFIS